VEVLHKIDLDVQEYEVTVILGANGAGKTTTMRAISGMIARRGEIEFAGKNIVRSSPEAIVRLGVAQVPQGRGTFTDLTVDDNLRAGAYVRRDDHVEHDIALWYETFPRLKERHAQKAGTLSGGEQQMLGLGQVLLLDPRLLVIDELSLGLAPVVVEQLLGVVEKLKQEGVTMVIVEQSINVALSIADRAVFMEKGQVRFEGAASDLIERDDLVRAVFLGADGS
jgi:branched-chain amino acid transport system ATP-binding protein